MPHEEESNLFGVEPGCPIHGDEKMRECSMCGAEFCRACHPRSTVCPDCAEPSDEDEEAEPDFEDISDLEDVLEEEEAEDEDDEFQDDADKDEDY